MGTPVRNCFSFACKSGCYYSNSQQTRYGEQRPSQIMSKWQLLDVKFWNKVMCGRSLSKRTTYAHTWPSTRTYSLHGMTKGPLVYVSIFLTRPLFPEACVLFAMRMFYIIDLGTIFVCPSNCMFYTHTIQEAYTIKLFS